MWGKILPMSMQDTETIGKKVGIAIVSCLLRGLFPQFRLRVRLL